MSRPDLSVVSGWRKRKRRRRALLAPDGFSAVPVSATQTFLSWNVSLSPNVFVDGYRIYRDSELIDSTSDVSYTDSLLTPGTMYTYSIEVFNTYGGSSSTDSIPVTTFVTVTPAAPTGLNAVALSDTEIALDWLASVDAVIGYKIYRDGVYIYSVTGTSYSDTGLTSGTQYSYEVLAYDASGNESTLSTPDLATTLT